MAGTVIARPAVARRLSAALDTGALLLIAPAGAGKTMALEEVLATRPGDVARVRCTSADGDAGRLLDHVVDVLLAAAPGVADVLSDMLATALGQVDPHAAARLLVAEIERLAVDPLTVVFDDGEHVADDAGAAQIVGALMGAASPALRVAVASRRHLPLRLAKLRAQRRLTQLGAADLAFTAGECEALLRGEGRADVSAAEVHAAMEATEGWPLGLALGYGRARNAHAPGAAPVSAEELSAFLVEEVLDPLDDEFREQLLRSSLPAELTLDLVNALGLGAGFLDSALQRDLFLRRLPALDGEVRLAYHPLFRELLLARLYLELSAPALSDLHARLAAAISGEQPLEAVEHWLAAGHEQEAVKLIGRNSQPLVRSSPDVVTALIGRLSSQGRSEPAIKLLEGQLAMGEGRHVDAVRSLADARVEWARRGSRAEWMARFSLAQALIVLGRFDEVRALADGIDEPAAADAVAAPMVGVWAALTAGGSGDPDGGEALLARSFSHPLGGLAEPPAEAVRACWTDWFEGRLDAAVARMERVLTRLEEVDPARWAPYFLYYTAYMQEQRGNDDAAVELLERSREVSARYGLGAYPGAIASAIKAVCDVRAGRLGAAETELARAEPHLGGSWHAFELYLARACLAAQRGAAGELLDAAERAYALGQRGYVGERLRAATLLAPLLVGAGATQRARAVVDETLAWCPPHVADQRLLALRAWLRTLDGDPAALDDLARAWVRAGDEARYLLRGEWPRIESLLWDAVERGLIDADEAVAAVQEAFPDGEALVGLLDHPLPRLRRAAVAAAATSGHPDGAAELSRLSEDADADVAGAARKAARRLRDEPPPLAFTLFGGFAVRRGRREVAKADWDRVVAARLVRFLLVNRGAAVPEGLLIEAFWPDSEPQRARRGLQTAVSAARAVLDQPGAEQSVIEVQERSYRLVLRPADSIDTERFASAATAALAESGDDRLAVLRAAAGLWAGDPLPEERYEGWAASWREGLSDLYSELLDGIARACFAAGDPFGATAAARRLVDLDPLNEAAQRALMTAFARSGRRAHALRQFLDCRRMLVDELGIEPAEQTEALQRAILAGESV